MNSSEKATLNSSQTLKTTTFDENFMRTGGIHKDLPEKTVELSDIIYEKNSDEFQEL